MDIESWKIDRDLAAEGTWVPIGGGARLRIARSSLMNPRWNAACQTYWGEHHAKTFSDDGAKKKDAERVIASIAATALLLEFDGLTEGGKPLECTPETRLRIMLECPELSELVYETANNRALFAEKAADGVVGKSKASSNGQPAGATKRSGSKA